MKVLELLKASASELRRVISLAVSSMLLAMHTVLGYFSIMIGPSIRIGFSFLAIAAAGMLYGPVVGGILGGLGDIINYILKPSGPFFPGLTISSMLTGFIYGLAFYKKNITIGRVFIAKLIVVIFVDLLLSTYWLTLLLGKGYMILLPARALKSAIMLPIDTIMLFIVLKQVSIIAKRFFKPQMN
ncbi:histidine kinase [Anaerocolumna cellulosilytica]|uniref:Histidine kinase n=1 Tax=Anaerocolumna cellulosilytica TaxID=433286 RepID=A0A6S6R0Y8_9FIRM|nr:folate family ECF transporter S component [Anaerocolumna cellulosilytica]MBB5193784.1 ECF transporter S component (folate family) [Anaerocolumna cellulosilytica]BCJ94999.1 histidine kinase [Anaerocolumna cellulosilytica]